MTEPTSPCPRCVPWGDTSLAHLCRLCAGASSVPVSLAVEYKLRERVTFDDIREMRERHGLNTG